MITLALGFGQLGELSLVERFTLLHRSKGDVIAVAVKGDFLFQRELLNDIQRLVVALVERTIDRALLLLKARMLEHCRERRQQVVDQLIDIGDKGCCAAVGQLQHTWLTRFVEIVYVNPVRRRLQSLAFSFQIAPHEGETPRPRLPHHIHVIAGARHCHAELQRLDCALLTEHTKKRLKFGGGVEVELAGLEGTGQRIGCQAQAGSDRFRHRESLLEWRI